MSKSVSIDISFDKEISVVHVIKTLKKAGWKLTDPEGKSMFLPLGDDGLFDWQIEVIKERTLLSLIKKKERNHENTGIIMYFESGLMNPVGISILMFSPQKILCSLGIYRRVIEGTTLTDFNWYVSRLIPILSSSRYIVSFKCEEVF